MHPEVSSFKLAEIILLIFIIWNFFKSYQHVYIASLAYFLYFVLVFLNELLSKFVYRYETYNDPVHLSSTF